MKIAKRLIALMLAAVLMSAIVVLSGCYNEETEIKVEGKEESFELLKGFFDKTLEDPDVVVTYTFGDEVQYTESIKGTTSNVVGKDGTFIYAYMEDDEYCYAYESDGMHYSEANKEYYDMYYCYFLAEIKLFESLVDEEGINFECVKHTKGKASDINFVFYAEQGSLRITATAKKGLVRSVTMESIDNANPDESRKATMTFEYNSAVVVLPDPAAWEHADNNIAAIYDRDDFFFPVLYSGNVKITVQAAESSYVETIANDIDYVAYSAGNKTYAFINYDDDEYIYAMDNVDSKIYFVDEYYYSFGRDVYYRMEISVFDSLKTQETVDFICNIDEDDEGNGTMTFLVKVDGETAATITATKVGGLVTRATVNSGQTVHTLTFEYVESELTAPDLTDWQRQSLVD